MKRNVTWSALLASLLLTTTLDAATARSPADNRVELGIQSLKAGDYNTALQWLESAEKKQAVHPDLFNALGLTHYQLGNLDTAQGYYLKAREGQRKHEAAYYLGKIHEKRNDIVNAKSWFKMASDQYEDPEIQAAADSALLSISLGKRPPTDRRDQANDMRQFAFVSLETSQVDGVVNPDDTSGTDDTDTTASLLVAGSTTLTDKTAPVDWKLGGSFFVEKYSDLSMYDIDAYSGFTSISDQLGDHLLEGKLALSRFNLDGNPYLEQAEISLKDTLALKDKTKLILRGRLINVTSPEDTYEYYAGDLAELGAELRGGDKLKWRMGLAWRTEDRNDITTSLGNISGEVFEGHTSYSRDWLRLKGRLSWKWAPKWDQKLEASFRSAEYQDADKYLEFSDDTELTEHTRNTDRISVKAELSRQITEKLDLNFRYEYLDDDSNNDRYDFKSDTLSAGVSYLF